MILVRFQRPPTYALCEGLELQEYYIHEYDVSVVIRQLVTVHAYVYAYMLLRL